jgi:hypothetical protein
MKSTFVAERRRRISIGSADPIPDSDRDQRLHEARDEGQALSRLAVEHGSDLREVDPVLVDVRDPGRSIERPFIGHG